MTADQEIARCWGDEDPRMAAYHDSEWGRPVDDDPRRALATRDRGGEIGKRYVETTAGDESVSLRLKPRKVMEFNGGAGR